MSTDSWRNAEFRAAEARYTEHLAQTRASLDRLAEKVAAVRQIQRKRSDELSAAHQAPKQVEKPKPSALAARPGQDDDGSITSMIFDQ